MAATSADERMKPSKKRCSRLKEATVRMPVTHSPTMRLADASAAPRLDESLPLALLFSSIPPDMKAACIPITTPKMGIQPMRASAICHEQKTKMIRMHEPTPPMSCATRSSCSVVIVFTLSTFSARKAVSSMAELDSMSKKPMSCRTSAPMPCARSLAVSEEPARPLR
eukprot:131631-Prymnesium_polylepis.1